MCSRVWGLAGSSLRLRKGWLPLRFWLFFNVGIPIPNPTLLCSLVSLCQHFLRTLDRESEIVKDTGHMGWMVRDGEFFFNHSGNHRTRPHARRESICHGTTIEDIRKPLSLLLQHTRRAPRPVPIQNAIDSMLLPVPYPDAHLGRVDLEDVGNLRSCLTFHVQCHRMETSRSPICPISQSFFCSA